MGESEDEKGSSWVSTAFILMNFITGVWVFGFPSAIDHSGGILMALGIQLVVIALMTLSTYMIGLCAELAGTDSFEATVYVLCGKVPKYTCKLFMFVLLYFSAVACLDVLQNQVDQILLQVYGRTYCTHWYLSSPFNLVVTSIFALPLCFVMRPDSFKIISGIGTFAFLYIIGLLSWKYTMHDLHDVASSGNMTMNGTEVVEVDHVVWIDRFRACAYMVVLYECQVEAVALYACLSPRTMASYMKMVCVGVLLTFVFCNVIGILAYGTLGEFTLSDLLAGYKVDSYVTAGNFMVALKALVTYPQFILLARLLLDELCQMLCLRVGLSELWIARIITVILFVTSVAVALYVPSLAAVIEFSGLMALFFGFFFPGACMLIALKEHKESLPKWSMVVSIIILIIGVVATIVVGIGTVSTIMNVPQRYNENCTVQA